MSQPGKAEIARRFGELRDRIDLLIRQLQITPIDADQSLNGTLWQRGLRDLGPNHREIAANLFNLYGYARFCVEESES